MLQTLNHMWINGEKVSLEETFEVINPASGEVIDHVPSGGEKETRLAVDAASAAFATWSKLTAKERSGYLLKWADNLEENRDQLALILTEEQGKPLSEAKGEIEGSAEFIRWYAEEGKRIYGDVIQGSSEEQRIMVFRQPVGVCGMITPWNFPGAMIARKAAPALASGCTVVLKPASQTPRIAIAMIEQLLATGIPGGVVNIVTGNPRVIGKTLFEDERVRKISFTGSTHIGKQLMRQAADQVKRISLELGGNAPVIVFPDADLDKAAEAIVGNKFENCGQMCNGINVIFAHQDIQTALTEKIVSRVQELEVGNGKDPVQLGPLVSDDAVLNVEQLVNDARQKGADVLVGGSRLKDGMYSSGAFYAPTVLTNVTLDMAMTKEEIFGPVAPILTFKDEKGVLQFSRQNQCGLAAYFFTKDINRVYRMAEGLDVGMVGVNGTQLSVPQAPFGGIKESGMGREGGHYGLDEFLEVKYISLTLED
ncbi:succinate-semialdehyde dehydrogenase/glutarate-semialdehyde dehydrogenase [Scopulibacillus darangshiensis]|uniref:Succinate-semialdehyde dehydrogenase/glutarate-semialdehyde dehydrogenase n=1 Tax=Scopulibacillus darangshiensis TaxID=442528 RepID=A0A4R2PA49_9BACL|nr:NAD-dependent succinate-semialdehyde dehydrogenase [Scopulibacillus darangshiensis]TCP31238.1 succinate-semialdehyde dehydrogenase/glutarate-semialdehyde dehydrogenase [Scopulibacillus darangshiensis]